MSLWDVKLKDRLSPRAAAWEHNEPLSRDVIVPCSASRSWGTVCTVVGKEWQHQSLRNTSDSTCLQCLLPVDPNYRWQSKLYAVGIGGQADVVPSEDISVVSHFELSLLLTWHALPHQHAQHCRTNARSLLTITSTTAYFIPHPWLSCVAVAQQVLAVSKFASARRVALPPWQLQRWLYSPSSLEVRGSSFNIC